MNPFMVNVKDGFQLQARGNLVVEKLLPKGHDYFPKLIL